MEIIDYQHAKSARTLPKIDSFMMAAFFARFDMKYREAERSETENYGDNCVNIVEVEHTEDNSCKVTAKIAPYPQDPTRTYTVVLTSNEGTKTITAADCQECCEICKHSIVLVTWLHRRSFDKSTDFIAEADPKVDGEITPRFIKTEDFRTNKEYDLPPHSNSNFLQDFVKEALKCGATDSPLMRYQVEPTPVKKLSLHRLMCSFMMNERTDPLDFLEYCREQITDKACEEAAVATTDQCACDLWYELRYARIMASKAYNVTRNIKCDVNLVDSILGETKFKDADALNLRLKKERVLRVLERKLKKPLEKCGLLLSATYPILGASPDAICNEFIIEVKCPTTEVSMKRYFTDDNKPDSKYYTQIQLQMHLSRKFKGVLCVAHSDFDDSGMCEYMTIDYDEQYCQNIILKCVAFWCKRIFPSLHHS